MLAFASDRAGDGNLDIWVQPVDGWGLTRLTDDPADDHEPSLSPDGATVAFRSERGEGGIYVAPATGGDAQLVFPAGRLPRFSPDGEWIAVATDVDYAPRKGAVHVVSSDGRKRRRVAADFVHASYPIWSADGRWILLSGVRKGNTALLPNLQSRDWFAVSLDGDQVVETEADGILTAHGLTPTQNNQFIPAVWDAQGWAYFSAGQGDTENIWRLRVSPTTYKAEGQPVRVTVGPGIDNGPVFLGHGEMVFSSLDRNINLWSLPITANSGHVAGPSTRLTSDAGDEFHPSITPDGTRLVYCSNNGAERTARLYEIPSGKQHSVASLTAESHQVILSQDGSHIADLRMADGKRLIHRIPSGGGAAETLCPGVSARSLWSWSTGGRFIAHGTGADPITISILDKETCDSREILSYLDHSFFQARFSPDDRWITFMSWDGERVTIWIVPFEGLKAIDHSRWIRVFGPSWADKPRWTPDANSLYFTGEAEGELVIYRQALVPRSKQPVGEREVVHRFPSGRYSFRDVELTARDIEVAGDKIVFPMAELTGNIWLMEP